VKLAKRKELWKRKKKLHRGVHGALVANNCVIATGKIFKKSPGEFRGRNRPSVRSTRLLYKNFFGEERGTYVSRDLVPPSIEMKRNVIRRKRGEELGRK